ncbi:MAG: hypothetical protein IKQ72_04120 [Bacteroidaceae bacterium]|nr:hypothetical protein [Bacteroidaceae bacterium]
MDKEKTKNGWGGKRAGSGRPKTTTIQRVYSIRTNDELAEFIESHENKSEFIKGCVIKEMKGLYANAVPNTDDAAAATATATDTTLPTADTTNDANDAEGTDAANIAEVIMAAEISDAPEATSTEEKKPAKDEYDDFDYSILGEVCTGNESKSVKMPFYDTKSDSSSFPMMDESKGQANEVDLLTMLCPHLATTSLIKVKGDSMTDADIYDGDIIIVDKSNRTPTERELAVCELNGEYTIKYVRVRDKYGILVPANRDYPEWRITPDDRFHVWGTVIYVIHKPRNI